MTWNPNAPATLGLEWRPTTGGSEYLDSLAKAPIESFLSSSTEPVTDLALYMTNVAGDSASVFGVEVFPAGSELAADAITTNNYPRTNTGKTSDASWVDAGLTPVDYFEINDPANDLFGFAMNLYNADTNALLLFRHGAGGPASYTGTRVLRVELYVRWRFAGGTGVRGAAMMEAPDGSGTFQVGDWQTPPLGPTYRNRRLAILDVSPFTGKPWTAAEATALFSTASTKATGVKMTFNSLTTAVQVSALYAIITTIPENRAAFGYRRITELGGSAGWKTFPLTKPDGAANWAKASGARYSIAARRVAGTGSMAWTHLDSGLYVPHVEHASYDPTVSGVLGRITALGAKQTKVRPTRLILASGESSDGQPYAEHVPLPATNAIELRQEVDQASAVGYGFVQALLRPTPGSDLALPDLTVTLRLESSGAVVAGPYNITRDEADALDDQGDGWKFVRVPITPGTLAGGTRYYLRFTTTGPDSNIYNFWQVAAPTTRGAGAASYRGTVNAAWWAGVRDTGTDLVATISTVPAAPSSFDVALAP